MLQLLSAQLRQSRWAAEEGFWSDMAAQGGVLFQEKVSRLLSRQDGKPVLKPNRPLALKDAVANRKLKKGGNDMNKDGVTAGSLYRRWLIVASLV